MDDFNKAIELKPGDDFTVYMISSLYALQQKTQDACEWLRRAIEMDIKHKNEAQNDNDFDLIRETSEFQALMHS